MIKRYLEDSEKISEETNKKLFEIVMKAAVSTEEKLAIPIILDYACLRRYNLNPAYFINCLDKYVVDKDRSIKTFSCRDDIIYACIKYEKEDLEALTQ